MECKPIDYEEHENLLIQLANSNGDVASITSVLQSLRDNYKLTSSEYEKTLKEVEEIQSKYTELERKNLDLFMKVTSDNVKEDENEDIEKDDKLEKLMYEDLFDKREG